MMLNPEKTAFLFPGQGSQKIGMGLELATEFPAAKSIFEQTDDNLGASISKYAWEGPEETLNDTYNTQPALLAHSTAVLTIFNEMLPEFHPAFFAGHSMGEFSALVAAGSLPFSRALQLVRRRGRLMKKAGELQPGGMAAVLGLDIASVDQVCQQASGFGGIVQVANDNCPGQVVISGTESALEKAMDLAKSAGARKVTRLAVSIASHSSLMVDAQEDFKLELKNCPFQDPLAPVIGNVNAAPLFAKDQICEDLETQLTSSVRWTETIQFMIDQGITLFIELGSGSVLTSLLKRINKDVHGLAIGSPSDFDILKAGEV